MALNDPPAASQQSSPSKGGQASSKRDCSPKESPFSAAVTDSYVSELRQYKKMMFNGDYGSDADARDDYKDDRSNARSRMQESRDARQKQKLAAAKAHPHASRSALPNPEPPHSKKSKLGSAKPGRKSWSSSKPKQTLSLSEMKEKMHDIVKDVPTILWLPPVDKNLEAEEEEEADTAEEELEDDGHRRRKFFSVVQASDTKNHEELAVYSAIDEDDGTLIYKCNLCTTCFKCEEMTPAIFKQKVREHNFYEKHCDRLRSLLLDDADGTGFVEWIQVEKNSLTKQRQATRNRKRNKTNSELSNVEDSEGLTTADSRPIPNFLLQMNEEYQDDGMNDWQVDLFCNFAARAHGEEPMFYEMPKYAVATQTWMSRRHGRQDFETLAGPDALRFSTQRTVQRHTVRKKEAGVLPEFRVGLDHKCIHHFAPTRFKGNLVSCNADGTRMRQEMARYGEELTGGEYSPDCCDWLPENLAYIPETKAELVDMLILHRDLQLLSSEVETIQFRSLTSRELPSFTIGIIPHASKGNTAFQQLKVWMHILNEAHVAGLWLTSFISDMCACCLCAGKILNTPSDEFIERGCSYIGLPVDDYKYFAVYCEPSPKDASIPRPFSKQWKPDGPHLIRLFRNNTDALAFLPFFTEKLGDLMGSMVAHYGCLREMAAKRLGDGMKLSEIVNINKYADFRNDSAFELVRQATIDLLTLHHPEDKATLLAMQSMFFLMEVVTNRNFTNASLATEYVWRCAGVWELQERYVRHVSQIARPSDCLPSYQFRDAIEMCAHFVTNHFIQFHLDCTPRGLTWLQCALSEHNQNELEGLHSRARHRSNGKMDVNFNVKEYATENTGMQEEADSKRVMQDGGVIFGEPKHTQATYQGKHNSLGQYRDEDDFAKSVRAYLPPDNVDDFIDDQVQARERGIAWARESYCKLHPLCREQFIGSSQWEERVKVPEEDEPLSCVMVAAATDQPGVEPPKMIAVKRRVREVQDYPDGLVLACSSNTRAGSTNPLPLPNDFISPNSLVVPKKEAKKLEKIEKEMREKAKLIEGEVTLLSDFDGNGMDGEVEGGLLEKLAALKKRSFQWRQSIASFKEPAKGEKKRKRVIALGLNGEDYQSKIASGEVVRCSDGSYESSDTIIARYQRHERIDRERRRRFMKRRITGFEFAVRAGHNVTLGTCMVIEWGKKDTFAVVRVYKMFDEKGDRAFSMKINKKCKKSQYRVELLVPVGETQLGSQRYRSSGWNLGPIGGSLIIGLIDLLPLSTLEELPRESRLHDALLPLEKIQELTLKGLKQITVDADGNLDVLGNDPKAERTSGWSLGDRCYACKLLWFDEKTGALVKCTKCTRVYHQDCAKPVIKTDEVDAFECSVCTGLDNDLCTKCDEPFSEKEVSDRDSLLNDELVSCSLCNKWYHQACHRPCIYPLPIGRFKCTDCVNCVNARASPSPEPAPAARSTVRAPRSQRVRAPAAAARPQPAPAERQRRSTATYERCSGSLVANSSIIRVWWSGSRQWYEGTVKSYDESSNEYTVHYKDDQIQDEHLESMVWELLSQPSQGINTRENSTRLSRTTWNSI